MSKSTIQFGFALAALAGLLGMGSPVNGAIVTYADRPSFDAAATSLTTIDFEGLAPPDSFTFFGSPPGLTVDGVNFQSTTDNLFVIDPNFSSPSFFFDSGQYLMDNTFQDDVNFRGLVATLPAGITAVGTDFSSFFTGDFVITLSTGEIVTLPSPGQPGYSFIGITSDIAIASLTFNKAGDSVVLDNFSFGLAASAVPEPTTFALAAMGVFGLATGAIRRRRRQAA